ncbi:MAG: hypothetical protein HXY22_06025 [Alphaproteobacteria bacterium]|nr:hypothetical protein [Alphaproteobacteria bacterium]
MPVKQRILIYSHDTFGLGHLRRCRTIAAALADANADASVLILSGSPIIGAFDFPARVDFIRLPGVIKLRNGDYVPRLPEEDLEGIIRLRSGLIDKVVEQFHPNLLIIDKEPLGLRGELEAALRRARGKGARIVLGLRDILDDADLLAAEWDRKRVISALEQFYDEIWVYGLEQIHDPLSGIGVSKSIRERMIYTGYLRRETLALPQRALPAKLGEGPFILVTTGGGGDGDGVIDWVLSAYEAGAPIGHKALLVLGPFMDRAHQQQFLARVQHLRDVEAITFDVYLEELLGRAAGVVAMGGYNTFCEILSLQKPALIVPRAAPRREQVIRAEAADRLGLAAMLRDPADDGLRRDPSIMAEALRALPDRPPPAVAALEGLLDGLPSLCRRAALSPRRAVPLAS